MEGRGNLSGASSTVRDDPSLSVQDLAFGYTPGSQVLAGVSFEVCAGEFVAVQGSSGAGKTTLLHCVAGLLTPRAGVVVVGGVEVTSLGRPARDRLRLERMGIVTQFGDLVQELTVLENVELPSRLLGHPHEQVRPRVLELLHRLGIDSLAARRVWEISGGQRQRAAVARALAHGPAVVLADEPTGSLDEKSASEAARLLIEEAAAAGAALLVSTHDRELASLASRVVQLESAAG